jgi:hypothetical protein
MAKKTAAELLNPAPLEMTENMKVLIEAQEVLRYNRFHLETLCTALFGPFIDPPEKSDMAKLLKKTTIAERRVQDELFKIATKKPETI